MNLQTIEPVLIFKDSQVPTGIVGWESPSNIALVKYWGKKDVQIPCNPSISFTLSQSVSRTKVSYKPAESGSYEIEFYLDGVRTEKFEEKIHTFFRTIRPLCPFIDQLHFLIESSNTFPHSAGIASSASGMSALALCIADIERKHLNSLLSDEAFFQKASLLARLGSGSACRSVYGGLVIWGEVEGMPETSNEYGVKLDEPIHEVFKSYKDSILIVDAAEKKVSSRAGHGLMNTNPFSAERFAQAGRNIQALIAAIRTGDLDTFIKLTELEALTLHAMMMTSDPYFLLMRPNTLSIIEKIFDFRQQTGLPVCFTLDAGPNVHLLYPQRHEQEIKSFIANDLAVHLHNGFYIDDQVGTGPTMI
jgi:diphosphomevalonate decarboxylase